MSHVTHMNESRRTYECVVSQALAETGWNESGMSHVTHTNDSCHTYNESHHTYI